MLTPGILKKHFVKPIEFNYSRAPEGAVIICFTSGSTFSLDNLKKKNFSLGLLNRDSCPEEMCID